MGANDAADAARLPRGGGLRRARRSSSPTATASRTASTCATGSTSRSARSLAATGRCSATTRPARAGRNPFLLDSKRPSIPLRRLHATTSRATVLVANTNPEEAERLGVLAQQDVEQRWVTYEEMASRGAGAACQPTARKPGDRDEEWSDNDGSHDDDTWGLSSEPAGRLGVAAVEHDRGNPAARGRGHRRDRAVLAVRGAGAGTKPRRTRRGPRPGPRASPSPLNFFPDLRRRSRAGRLSQPDRARGRGRGRPGDREPQRRHRGRMDRIRRA